MDLILMVLPPSLLEFVEVQLSNDEVSSDEEMLEYFINSGLTRPQAEQALTYRNLYLNNIYMLRQTPIRVGDQSRSFSPHLRWIEPI
ncbi:hypothetical protein ABXK61_13095 [Burkholderia sola]|uniref:hypothetical protein n=1 Tax=Burkholderia TaxID=32008 RepID=UPI001AE37DAA|nr:hypothetical protein [Burkholderia sp. AcTa6-5]MBP0714248.1 hypothetical protein [Burkholderia sp. AcTa6-5]